MRNLLMVGVVALGLAGCALESGQSGEGAGQDESETGEVQEAVSTFTKTFSFRKHYVGESTFVVPVHGTVTVAAHATWNRPGACKLPTFTIDLDKAGLFGSEGARTYTTNGATTTQKWTNLGVGTYHFVFDSTNDTGDCQLIGAVTVTITP
jgi:hypothetical protein